MSEFNVDEYVNIIKDGVVFAKNAIITFIDVDDVFTVKYHNDNTGYFYKDGTHIFVAGIYLEKIK